MKKPGGRLLVAGAGGFLGTTFTREAIAAGRTVAGAFYTRQPAGSRTLARVVNVDLSRPAAARALLRDVKPAWVVNCAGFTSVDDCERDPERARLLNVELPQALATACAEVGAGLVHFSTDSVFDGNRGNYTEDDAPSPLNVYARTKLEGERAAIDALPDTLVIRTNFIGLSPARRTGLADWLAGRFESGQRISGFTDCVFAPLLANDLARTTMEMMTLGLYGLYHLAASDSSSKYEFARLLGAALGCDSDLVTPANVATAGFVAPRPLNTSLSSSRAESALGRRMASVSDAVAGYVALRKARGPAAINQPAEA